MRHSNYIAAILLFFLSGSIQGYSQENYFRNSVSIQQKSKVYTFTKSFDSLTLNRDTFAIVFDTKKYNEKKKKWYATQVAAVTNDSLVLLVKAGQKLQNIPFFSEGSGLAAEEFGYTNLFIDNDAHHYITYTHEKDRRAELVSVSGETVKLVWNIHLAYYQDKDFEFSKLPLGNFYLILFNDDNLNKVIDEGEYLSIFITLP